jgi:LPXTG-motif cell wall-anchored protein
MLNKRIKSLLVAGLLVLGMGFAKVDSFALEPITSTITNPKLIENKKTISLQGGSIIVEVTKTEDGYIFKPRWDSNKFKVLDIKAHYDDELNTVINSESYFVSSKCYPIEENSNVYKSDAIDMKINANLIKVEVIFMPIDEDNNGIPDFKDSKPVDPNPEEEIKDPETGDTSMIAIIGIATASAAGLVLTRKKDDEE